ncbi:hypothetical protein IFHNHDMJ_00372 [Synechococcus sp. CBW1107]|nr:hypothetical protein IFHNHDMJ_00372 [Synechococcus sp. CBW1107]
MKYVCHFLIVVPALVVLLFFAGTDGIYAQQGALSEDCKYRLLRIKRASQDVVAMKEFLGNPSQVDILEVSMVPGLDSSSRIEMLRKEHPILGSFIDDEYRKVYIVVPRAYVQERISRKRYTSQQVRRHQQYSDRLRSRIRSGGLANKEFELKTWIEDFKRVCENKQQQLNQPPQQRGGTGSGGLLNVKPSGPVQVPPIPRELWKYYKYNDRNQQRLR